MYKIDLQTRISVIEKLEKEISQEPNRLFRRKKLNELMCARENIRLQFRSEYFKDAEMLDMLTHESVNFVKFQEHMITQFGSSNAEFSTYLRIIMDTCEESKYLDNQATITQANESLSNISTKLKNGSNPMKSYRLRTIKRCQLLLDQFSKEQIKSNSKSLECCTNLDKEEMSE